MPAPGLESGLEEFLLKVVPGLAEQWQGSPPEEIAQIEELAGRPLPPCYRWFLSRMGRNMGPLAFPRLDFSAQRVLTSYAEGLIEPDSQFLFIGHDPDKYMPLHFFLDLDLPARGDARVTRRPAEGHERYDQFETFREQLAYGALLSFRIGQMKQRCTALFRSNEPEVLSYLTPVMDGLGFARPVLTGRYCELYLGQDAAMVCDVVPRDEPLVVMGFTLGGSDSGALRKLLGIITTETPLTLKRMEWDPPLP